MKKVKLDPSKVTYDGKSFTVVITEKELNKKFKRLSKSIKKQLKEK
jgi:hypothetical protein